MTTQSTVPTRMVDAKQVAQRFGVSPATVARWHRNGEMPRGLVINRRTIRWAADAIDGWIARTETDIEQATP